MAQQRKVTLMTVRKQKTQGLTWQVDTDFATVNATGGRTAQKEKRGKLRTYYRL